MTGRYVVTFDSPADSAVSRVGGKCAGLLAMTRAGCSVPPGFVVTTNAFEALLADAGLRKRVDAVLAGLDVTDPVGTEVGSAEIRRLVGGHPVPPRVAAAVTGAYDSFCEGAGVRDAAVAVRSSAQTEDLPGASFAGQYDTYLGVRGADAVLDAVRRCWASLWTTRAVTYRAANAVPEEGLKMAVGVQKMVDARTAGVAMTLNPADGDRSKIVIDAGWGLGAPLVSGEVTPDNYVVDKVLLVAVRTTVSPKSYELIVAPGGQGLVRNGVEDSRGRVACLAPDEVTAVARLAKEVERHYGFPLDIEWAIDREPSAPGDVLLLQARAETVWSRRPRRPTGVREGAGVGSIVDTMLGLRNLPT
ncbi:PEP/pyruvate-binding domain-containing protein [Streptomyces sp. NBC_01262]|uniref:PEP/pyruvate-binding domain-containing protein n=1 Tax=Streptomyces sp. NBC_01262 TaxID=2903803 RepID=UPI002E33C4F8|nr:PEP/pyruvate-binding domain-containing protein [Streptomyces sp. NBC_01262]